MWSRSVTVTAIVLQALKYNTSARDGANKDSRSTAVPVVQNLVVTVAVGQEACQEVSFLLDLRLCCFQGFRHKAPKVLRGKFLDLLSVPHDAPQHHSHQRGILDLLLQGQVSFLDVFLKQEHHHASRDAPRVVAVGGEVVAAHKQGCRPLLVQDGKCHKQTAAMTDLIQYPTRQERKAAEGARWVDPT
jgi:hypothetical protein